MHIYIDINAFIVTPQCRMPKTYSHCIISACYALTFAAIQIEPKMIYSKMVHCTHFLYIKSSRLFSVKCERGWLKCSDLSGLSLTSLLFEISNRMYHWSINWHSVNKWNITLSNGITVDVLLILIDPTDVRRF